MPKGKSEPEYRRRIRQKAENEKHEAEGERRHRENRDAIDGIIGQIGAFKAQAQAHKKDHDREWQSERRWHLGEIFALTGAAMVGLVAICFSHWDSSRQLAAFKDQFIESQRAWIDRPKIEIAGPLTWNKTGANLDVSFRVKNIGKTPAIYFSFHAWLLPVYVGIDAVKERMQRCDQIRKEPFPIRRSSPTIFPGQPFPDRQHDITVGIGMSQVEISDAIAANSGRRYFGISIIGCTDYTFSSDPSIHHQTGFEEILTQPSPELAFFSPDQGTIPRDNLKLTDYLFTNAD